MSRDQANNNRRQAERKWRGVKLWKVIVNRAWSIRVGALLFSLLISIVMVLGGTMAWFTSSDNVVNPFHTVDMQFDLSIVETFIPTSAGPGDTVTKEVAVTNNGDLPAFVRLMVLPEILAADGETLLPVGGGDVNPLTYEGLDSGDNWLYGGDGYWYYLKKLDLGQTTPLLFTGVTLHEDLPDEYQNATMTIDVKLEAARTTPGEYRSSWWGDPEEPTDATLKEIDGKLQSS